MNGRGDLRQEAARSLTEKGRNQKRHQPCQRKVLHHAPVPMGHKVGGVTPKDTERVHHPAGSYRARKHHRAEDGRHTTAVKRAQHPKGGDVGGGTGK